nr:unnamed protein product [Digitaria exilis]
MRSKERRDEAGKSGTARPAPPPPPHPTRAVAVEEIDVHESNPAKAEAGLAFQFFLAQEQQRSVEMPAISNGWCRDDDDAIRMAGSCSPRP